MLRGPFIPDQKLGIAGADSPELTRLFKQEYQGSRYSFGYPACPRLEDQEKLFTLLNPSRIDVELTEEFQLEPEQSTCQTRRRDGLGAKYRNCKGMSPSR